MLVLTRKKGEIFRVGDDVKITIVDIRGDKVRVGIEAPNAVPVHREEIYQAIQQDCQGGGGDGDGRRPNR